MNKLVLLKVRDLPTEETIEPNKDYRITLIAQRKSEEKLDSNSDDEYESMKYRLEVLNVESIEDIRDSKKVTFEQGLTPSQKQRFAIEQEIGDDYEPFMKWLLTKIPLLCERFRDGG